MAKDLTVFLENRPGTLAELGEKLGEVGVNIDGLAGFPCEGQGVIHILVEDAAAARRALEAAGIESGEERDVLVLEVQDKPGVFGDVCRKIASLGVNVDLAYVAANNRLVLGADDLAKAQSAL